MNEDVSFINMDTYRGSGGDKFGLSFKQILLMHINRCVLNGSVEWHGGYWNEVQTKEGISRVYVPNTRDIWINTVKIMRALLLGYTDDKMKGGETKYQDKLKKLRESYKDKKKDICYHNKNIKIHMFLFEELILLSKRENFFQERTAEETV